MTLEFSRVMLETAVADYIICNKPEIGKWIFEIVLYGYKEKPLCHYSNEELVQAYKGFTDCKQEIVIKI